MHSIFILSLSLSLPSSPAKIFWSAMPPPPPKKNLDKQRCLCSQSTHFLSFIVYHFLQTKSPRSKGPGAGTPAGNREATGTVQKGPQDPAEQATGHGGASQRSVSAGSQVLKVGGSEVMVQDHWSAVTWWTRGQNDLLIEFTALYEKFSVCTKVATEQRNKMYM